MLSILKASAGSGKTFRLTYEYIALVLGHRDSPDSPPRLNPVLLTNRPSLAHRNILAITFTNKATEEMKTRIVTSLAALGKATRPDDHDYARRLMDLFGCTFDQLRTAAGNATASLLLDFGFFNVSTIDAFFQTILRTFARELDIQGDYNIRIKPEDVICDALNLMLDDLNAIDPRTADPQEKRVSKWLSDFVSGRLDSDTERKFSPFQRGSSLYRSLIHDVRDIFTEQFKPLQLQLRLYLDNPDNLTDLNTAINAGIASLAVQRQEATMSIRNDIDAAGLSAYTAKNFSDAIDKFAAGLGKDARKFPKSLLALMDGDLHPKQALFTKKMEPDAVLSARLLEFGHTVATLTGRAITLDKLKALIPKLEFIGLMMKYLDRVRQQDNMLILDDTSTHIERIIGGSYVPFIYEHLGNRYRHFLIDEFQDTSRLQWKNLLPLMRNCHDEGETNLIIGDTKQAIYRFRNSDSSILGHDLENNDFPDPAERTVEGTTPKDNRNWRTAHGIVRFNNAFLPLFAANILETPTPPGFCGGEVIQETTDKTATLPSRITFIPCTTAKTRKTSDIDPTPTADDYDVTVPVTQRPAATTADHKMAAAIAEIKAQHHLRGMAWQDIAVLVRNNDTATEIITELIANGIPVQSAESLYLRNAPSVRLMLGLLTMLSRAGVPDATIRRRKDDEPSKSRATARMEQSLFESRFEYFSHSGALTPQQAIELALDPEAIQIDTDIDSAVQGILDLHPSTLVATIEAIIARQLIPSATVEAEKDYLATFTDRALWFSEQYSNDVSAFLAWWNTHGDKLTIAPPAECDAVRIMTIHKAKGLEFGCVHLLDFGWNITDDREKAWIDARPGNPNGISLDLPDIPDSLIPPMIFVNLAKSSIDYPCSPFAPLLSDISRNQRIDALNLVYVAMTRAKSELTIYYDPTAADTVAGIAATTLRQLVTAAPHTDPLQLDIDPEWLNPDTGAFHFSCPPAKQPDPTPDTGTTAPAETSGRDMPAIDYSNIGYLSSVRHDMLSFVTVASLQRTENDNTPDIDMEDMDDDSDSGPAPATPLEIRMRHLAESTRRGVDLHDILAGMTTADQLDSALEKASANPGFDTSAADSYRHTLASAVTDTIADRWFNPTDRISTEISYFTPTENALDAFRQGEVRRIDRMVEHTDGTVDIVDYKFTSAKSSEHAAQVRRYVTAMADILPGRTIRGYLWYIDLGTIEPVP